MRIIVAESAFRHSVAEADMIHALRFQLREYEMDEGFRMIIGVGRAGQLLEIGLSARGGRVRIVHAMPARARFGGR